ncbi:MAG: hypothetical protein PVG30_02225 [Gammaproteobacteria bacterium]|jgi:hypothetical protein
MSKAYKLNQIIAIEKEVTARTKQNISNIYKLFQKNDLFNGFTKKYQPLNDEGEKFADENKKVIANVESLLNLIVESKTESFDFTLTKDTGNTNAFSDIIVDDVTIVKHVPVTFIIYLEKQLIDIRTMINSLPTLDINEDWKPDINSNIFRTDSIQTHRTKKVPKVLIRYEATEKHPAQTEVYNEDVIIGYWNTEKLSGAMPIPNKEKLLKRVEKLIKAVKMARETANSIEVEKKYIGNSIFKYLFE